MDDRLKLTERQTEIFYQIQKIWEQLDKNNIAFGYYRKPLDYEGDWGNIIFFNKEHVDEVIVQDNEEPIPEGWVEVDPEQMESIELGYEGFYDI